MRDIDETLLPEVGATYRDDIGRILKVQQVVPENKQGREVIGLLTAQRSRHLSQGRDGSVTSFDISIPLMVDMPYSCPLHVFEKMWKERL